jgi:DinB superfamily
MDIHEAAAAYEVGTRRFLDAARAAPAHALDRRHPDGWSARQVIHHVADSEAQSYARLRRLLAEPDPLIQGYDEAAWAAAPALGYEELPVEHAIAVTAAVRAASLDLVRRMGPADLERSGRHSEAGTYSVRTWLGLYIAHPADHAAQLERALRGEA